MNKLTILACILIMSTSACTIMYVPDVQQGNVISDEMLAMLKPGMNPKQVRFVLGTSLIKDPFHKNRWDYFYSYKDNENGTFKKRLVSILFKDGKMVDVRVEPKSSKPETIDKRVTIKPEIHDKGESASE